MRIATQLGHGSVLYGHLLNARAAAARWEGCCCSFVMQASNMLWLKTGWEGRVEELRSSVGQRKIHMVLFAVLMSQAIQKT